MKYNCFNLNEKYLYERLLKDVDISFYYDSKDPINYIIRDIRSIVTTQALSNNCSIKDLDFMYASYKTYINTIESNKHEYILFEDLVTKHKLTNYYKYNWKYLFSPSQNNRAWNNCGNLLAKLRYSKFCSEPFSEDQVKQNISLDHIKLEKLKLDVPSDFRKGSLQSTQIDSVKSGKIILEYIKEIAKFKSYSNIDLLDYGCGVKFSQALLQFNIEISSYTGIDLDTNMVNFLTTNISSKHSNFIYKDVNFNNAMYNDNPNEFMRADLKLPIKNEMKDLITCQSVFTHLNHTDFYNLLAILRQYISKDGHLFFTCFLDDFIENDYQDYNPANPLVRIFYKQEFVFDLLRKAGWKPILFRKRSKKHFVGDHFLCSPL